MEREVDSKTKENVEDIDGVFELRVDSLGHTRGRPAPLTKEEKRTKRKGKRSLAKGTPHLILGADGVLWPSATKSPNFHPRSAGDAPILRFPLNLTTRRAPLWQKIPSDVSFLLTATRIAKTRKRRRPPQENAFGWFSVDKRSFHRIMPSAC